MPSSTDHGEEMQLSKVLYGGWDSTCLKRGALEIFLVPQLGGRLGLRWAGKDLLWTNPQLRGCRRDPEIHSLEQINQLKDEEGFPLWGLGKTWLSPQGGWNKGTPYFMLDSGAYQLNVLQADRNEAMVQMLSAICPESGCQLSRTVRLSRQKARVTLEHTLFNRSNRPVRHGLWDVLMVQAPGMVYLPKSSPSSHPEGVKVFANEGEAAQLREQVVQDWGEMVAIDCRARRTFKYGTDSSERWLCAVSESPDGGYIALLEYFDNQLGEDYGHGCAQECYNSGTYDYFEVEAHGALVELAPGQSVTLNTDYCIEPIGGSYPSDPAAVRKLLGTS